MILNKMVIKGFRSIRQEVVLHLDTRVTILIGANDHGKTNVLDALKLLNDDTPLGASDRNWDAGDDEQIRIEYHFTLSADDAAKVADKLAGLHAARLDQTIASLPSDADEKTRGLSESSVEVLVARTKSDLAEGRPVVMSRSTDTPIELAAPADAREWPELVALLLAIRPRVEGVEVSGKLTDQVTLDDLENGRNPFMEGVFRKAGIWSNRAQLFTVDPRSAKQLANGSEHLTEQIRKDWEQGKSLKFKLVHAGANGDRIELQIDDPSVKKQYVRPSQRSLGFSTYFALSLGLFARTEGSQTQSVILLFDEPGTYLHPLGQVNLQRVIEAFARTHQVVYTTHSIFLVSKNFPARNRVVAKGDQGTTIDHKPFQQNWKAVKSSLGLTLANNVYVADTTLLVEGASDPIFVSSLLRTLNSLGVIDADLNAFSVMEGGRSSEYVALAKVLSEEGRRVVCLVDGDEGGRAIAKKTKKLTNGTATGGIVEVLQLEPECSIENYVAFPDLLRAAAIEVANELVTEGHREWAEGKGPAECEAAVIAAMKGDDQTRGKLLEKHLAPLFKEAEAVSKLLIARRYDALVEQQPGTVVGEVERPTRLAKDIVAKLGLESKAARRDVLASR